MLWLSELRSKRKYEYGKVYLVIAAYPRPSNLKTRQVHLILRLICEMWNKLTSEFFNKWHTWQLIIPPFNCNYMYVSTAYTVSVSQWTGYSTFSSWVIVYTAPAKQHVMFVNMNFNDSIIVVEKNIDIKFIAPIRISWRVFYFEYL